MLRTVTHTFLGPAHMVVAADAHPASHMVAHPGEKGKYKIPGNPRIPFFGSQALFLTLGLGTNYPLCSLLMGFVMKYQEANQEAILLLHICLIHSSSFLYSLPDF